MNARNPSPVYTASAVWVARENHTTGGCVGCLAQVGWTHTNTIGNPTIFSERTDSTGNYYYPPVTYNQFPSGSLENFSVSYSQDLNGNPQWFVFSWNEASYSYAGTFKPNGIMAEGEVQDYTPCSPVNCGSQAVGDSNDPINISPVTYRLVDGINRNPVLGFNSNGFNRTPNQKLTSYSGNSFSIWDSRCLS